MRFRREDVEDRDHALEVEYRKPVTVPGNQPVIFLHRSPDLQGD
jgi:hypothetical protein